MGTVLKFTIRSNGHDTTIRYTYRPGMCLRSDAGPIIPADMLDGGRVWVNAPARSGVKASEMCLWRDMDTQGLESGGQARVPLQPVPSQGKGRNAQKRGKGKG